MTITFVEHDTAEPALYGAMAAVLARARGAEFAHLPAMFDTRLKADAVQHVAAIGALVPSGLVWFERLTGREVGREAALDELLLRAQSCDLVVPWHRPLAADGQALAHLVDRTAAAGITVEHFVVTDEADGWRIRSREGSVPTEARGPWRRDRFGRLKATASDRGASRPELPLRIGLVGAESDHRWVFPAALAALGDASDTEGSSTDVLFIAPIGLSHQDVDDILAETDGLLLPGGSDMANVPGQILMAEGALRSRTPTIGLCLGMQTMTTAIIQKALGSSRANLAEADPSAPIKTFVPLFEEGSLPAHRLGEQRITVASGSRLHYILGREARIRCNHRFRLNPELRLILENAGLRISAHDGSGRIAEAIELTGHPFYLGMQGHPELSSRSGAPHPLIRAFLQACRSHAAVRSREL
ncbi:Glutamine amidotransferase class-I [Rhizobiales bacterium GAS191]|nr:Glutamine amidotransferase class-I [Rhizobiales bacterium GAS191]